MYTLSQRVRDKPIDGENSKRTSSSTPCTAVLDVVTAKAGQESKLRLVASDEEHRVGNLCAHSGFLLTMAIGVAVIGIAASLVAGEWHWFSRSGAIVVLIGVLMSARKCVRVGFEGLLQDATTIDCNPSLQASEQKNAEKEHNQDIGAAQRGIWVAVVGTLIWGFGDLPDLVASMNSGI